MGQDGALVLSGEGKEQGLMQSGEEMAVGALHSGPPIEGKGNFSKHQ